MTGRAVARALWLVVLVKASTVMAVDEGARSISDAAVYELVWSDEFDTDGEPDERSWTYEVGFVRNEELQWYQKENVGCVDGLLVIEARRERVANSEYEAGRRDWRRTREYAEYTSASLTTKGRHEWTYGRFEMRGRIDVRAGLWPAFWTLGSARPWPGCGEIDIMEFYRGELLANACWGSSWWRPAWDKFRKPLHEFADPDWAKKFHIWRMDWDESEIRLYVDDTLLNTIELAKTLNRRGREGTNPFREPHYILLNLAVGGTQGGDPSQTEFPARFEVDYVRVYQKKSPPEGEVLFSTGPQEYGGRRYYWLAEWRLELTLPDDVTAEDELEVLFGSKGEAKRTLLFEQDGRVGSLSDVRRDAYEWIKIPLESVSAGKKVVLYGKGREQVAFLAGVRVKGPSASAPKVKAIPTSAGVGRGNGEGVAVWADLPGFEVNEETRRLWDPSPDTPDWRRAERSARYAGIALSKIQRWLHERCLPLRDSSSGLFRPTGREWNYRDTAADCYPFYVWAAYYTDREVLETVMVDVLKAEQRLCNHLDRLPVSYDMDAGRKIPLPLSGIIFGASEYAKDGLVPIVEITGKDSPWFDRLRGIVDDIFAHASIETPYGSIPSENIEVNGELLQILPRLYSMTGERQYLNWAHRLADYYLLPGRFVPSRLSDHGCEIIGGLGLLFAVDSSACREKTEQYRPHLEYMFGEILRRGRNSHGVIVGRLEETPGPHDNVRVGDGWGYDLVGFLDYDLSRGVQRHHAAIQRPLENLLNPRYTHFNWDHGSRDNIADSVEGGLYLLHRIPTTAAFVWADREIATVLVDHTNPERLWGTHKLEANTVRTVLIHTMLHTRNTIARPWQPGLELGAAPSGRGICIFMASGTPYEGKLQFDVPRHRIHMGFERDWPRMNAMPEWFTVTPDETHLYKVNDVDTGDVKLVTGEALSAGIPVRVRPQKPLRLTVEPQE